MDDYIVSARKYRPMTFGAVVGQHALTTTLRNAVISGKLAHAYLFCGPRGVGKTTCARIFAKAINCLNPSGGEACGHCESCRMFNEQRSMNIFELDAASNNSVENIKALMEQTRIPPQTGRYKVFIIDEVHMLSTAAFNAFLKTLEEPPAQVIFILATTEKHKILPTIISRCQIYDFERMTVNDIIGHLKEVAAKEGIAAEDEALALIAEKADGGMRDALSMFDQAMSYCQGAITYKGVLDDLNEPDVNNYFQLVDLAAGNDVTGLMLLFNDILSEGHDGGKVINGLASHVRNVLMAKDERTIQLIDASEQQRLKYAEQARRCSATFLYKSLRLMNQCDINYRQSNNKRLLAELTLIQMAQLTQPVDNEGDSAKPMKSPFTNTAVPHKTPTKQTAAEENKTAETQKADSEKTKRAHGNIKASAVGVTFSSLMGSTASSTTQHREEITNKDENEPFGQEELERQWVALCSNLSDETPAMTARLSNMRPHIVNFPEIELTAENANLLEYMNNKKDHLQALLAKALHNGAIKLTVRQVDTDEIKPMLSRQEMFTKITNDNPAFAKLSKGLGLQLV